MYVPNKPMFKRWCWESNLGFRSSEYLKFKTSFLVFIAQFLQQISISQKSKGKLQTIKKVMVTYMMGSWPHIIPTSTKESIILNVKINVMSSDHNLSSIQEGMGVISMSKISMKLCFSMWEYLMGITGVVKPVPRQHQQRAHKNGMGSN